MSVSGGPSIVTNNLLLNLEIFNPKSYSYSENLIVYSQAINSGNGWGIGSNTTFITSSNTAPDGTLTASSFYGNGSSANEYVVKQVPYTANTWYQIVMTYTGTVLTGYVNSVQQYTGSVTRTGPGTAIYYTLAGPSDITNLGNGAYYSGSIGAMRYYNRALTATEVLQNFRNLGYRYGL